jgi:hypothetical protein
MCENSDTTYKASVDLIRITEQIQGSIFIIGPPDMRIFVVSPEMVNHG